MLIIIPTKPVILVIIAGIFCIAFMPGCAAVPAALPASAPSTLFLPAGEKNVNAVLPQFDAYAKKTFQRSGVPGMAVAIVQNDTVVYMRCFGVRNITTKEPVSPDTRFQLASISKSFTSATIASMVGRGELSWDDRVATIMPDFQLSDPWVTSHLTFRDLLSHRTGLPQYVGDELQYSFQFNRYEILHSLRFVQPTGEFRSTYAYVNADVTAAAEVASKHAGKTWEDLVTERVLVPAGMMNSSPRFADFASAKDHADTYTLMNGTAVAMPLINDDPNSPAGGVSSSIRDMTRYARLHLNDGSINGTQVIAADAIRETHRPQIIVSSTNTSMTAYGLGWEAIAENGRVRVEHGGDLTSGVSTYITLYPADSMAIVVLTNAFPEGHILTKSLTKGWDDLYFTGAVRKDWYSENENSLREAIKSGGSVLSAPAGLPETPATPKPARPLSAYTGTYTQDYYGDIRVDANETGLLMYPGHSTTQYFLVPYDGDTFRETSSDTGVYFTPGNGGTAGTVQFTIFDMPGRNGTFVRASPV